MAMSETGVGIIVTLGLAVLLVYVITRIWAYENERPTETIGPE